MKEHKLKPLAGSVGAGFIASVCCAGSLIFASVGLGAFYATLSLWKYVPQVLAAGALSIVSINYFFYHRAAESACCTEGGDLGKLRWSMFVSAALGLAAMAGSFVLLEWFNHAVVYPDSFLSRPEYGQALIPGVPNLRLINALASFAALGLLWAMPFPSRVSNRPTIATVLRWGFRVGMFMATAGVLIVLVINALGLVGTGGGVRGPHTPGDVPKHQPPPHSRP